MKLSLLALITIFSTSAFAEQTVRCFAWERTGTARGSEIELVQVPGAGRGIYQGGTRRFVFEASVYSQSASYRITSRDNGLETNVQHMSMPQRSLRNIGFQASTRIGDLMADVGCFRIYNE